MQSLAPVAAQFGVVVSVVEPAAIATNLLQNTDMRNLAMDPDGQYGRLADSFQRFVARSWEEPQSARDAAAVVVDAVTSDTPRFRWQISKDAVSYVGLSLRDLDGSRVVSVMSDLLR